MRVAVLVGLGGFVGLCLGVGLTLLVRRLAQAHQALGRRAAEMAGLRDVSSEALIDELSRRGLR